jgi:hypothetical protein
MKRRDRWTPRSAFTLVEVLIACGVIAILCAVAFPLIKSGKRAGQKTVSLSNLRQMGIAVQLYCDTWETGNLIPSGQAARELLAHMPTCDPADYWTECKSTFGDPLIGSYAYARLVDPMKTEEGWREFLLLRKNPTIFLSVFYSSNKLLPLHGLRYQPSECANKIENCMMPDMVLRLRLDGSAKAVRQRRTSPNGGTFLMTWPALFLDDDPSIELIHVRRQ